jgi:hypothetical protein
MGNRAVLLLFVLCKSDISENAIAFCPNEKVAVKRISGNVPAWITVLSGTG